MIKDDDPLMKDRTEETPQFQFPLVGRDNGNNFCYFSFLGYPKMTFPKETTRNDCRIVSFLPETTRNDIIRG